MMLEIVDRAVEVIISVMEVVVITVDVIDIAVEAMVDFDKSTLLRKGIFGH